MELFEAIETRRSVRSFKPDAVPHELADKIAKAGTFAATGRNAQSPIIIQIENRELRDRISKMNAAVMGTHGDPFYGAPLIFAVLADRTVSTHVYDGSLVIGSMMLAAHGENGCEDIKKRKKPIRSNFRFFILRLYDISVLAWLCFGVFSCGVSDCKVSDSLIITRYAEFAENLFSLLAVKFLFRAVYPARAQSQ